MGSLSDGDVPRTTTPSPAGDARDDDRVSPGELAPLVPDAGAKTLATNVAAAIAYGESLVGTKFAPWTGGPLQEGAPMWTANAIVPAPALVKSESANAAGLVNLMLRAIGKTLPSDPVAGTGGTGAYARYYANVAKPFDVNLPWPEGTLIGRDYRDVGDQGHLAVVLRNGKVLQSFASAAGATTPGVNTAYTVIQSHAGHYYEYAVLPEDWLAP